MSGDGENEQQLPDGRWVPAQPLGWQPGIDWEVYKPGDGGRDHWEAVAYDEDVPVAVVRARSKFWLTVKVSWRHRQVKK